jgi:hypothetical protein
MKHALLALVMTALLWPVASLAEEPPKWYKWRDELVKLVDLSDELAEKSDNTKAREIVAFIRDRGFPKDIGSVVIASSHVIPIEPLPKGANSLIMGETSYDDTDDKVTIRINNGQISPIFKALSLIHEGDHAMKSVAKEYFNIPSKLVRKTIYELSAYEVAMQVMIATGGPDYKAWLDAEINSAKSYALTGQLTPLDKAQYKLYLDRYFGPAYSEEENIYRITMHMVAIYFSLYDRIAASPDEAYQKKTIFMMNVDRDHTWP